MWLLGFKGLKGFPLPTQKLHKSYTTTQKLHNEWYYVNVLLRRFHLIGRIPPKDSKVTIAY